MVADVRAGNRSHPSRPRDGVYLMRDLDNPGGWVWWVDRGCLDNSEAGRFPDTPEGRLAAFTAAKARGLL